MLLAYLPVHSYYVFGFVRDRHSVITTLFPECLRCFTCLFLQDDVFTHLYTLIVNPDNTYEVQIDGEKAESGELEADWDFLPPKKIKVIILSVVCLNERIILKKEIMPLYYHMKCVVK